jgi:hypothetical protein
MMDNNEQRYYRQTNERAQHDDDDDDERFGINGRCATAQEEGRQYDVQTRYAKRDYFDQFRNLTHAHRTNTHVDSTSMSISMRRRAAVRAGRVGALELARAHRTN